MSLNQSWWLPITHLKNVKARQEKMSVCKLIKTLEMKSFEMKAFCSSANRLALCEVLALCRSLCSANSWLLSETCDSKWRASSFTGRASIPGQTCHMLAKWTQGTRGIKSGAHTIWYSEERGRAQMFLPLQKTLPLENRESGHGPWRLGTVPFNPQTE